MAPGTANQPEFEQPRPALKGKVLIVDQEQGDLHFYRSTLNERGYDVRACGSYSDGRCCLDKEGFDLVIVSQGSRCFDGRTVLEHVVAAKQHPPVLVVARCLDMGCYLQAMEMGAADYLEEPLSASQIVRVVETHLRRPPMGR